MFTIPFRAIDLSQIAQVGGKNASLGELFRSLEPKGIRVPDGFAITSEAFRLHLKHAGLSDWVYAELSKLDVRDVEALRAVGEMIRGCVRPRRCRPRSSVRCARRTWRSPASTARRPRTSR